MRVDAVAAIFVSVALGVCGGCTGQVGQVVSDGDDFPAGGSGQGGDDGESRTGGRAGGAVAQGGQGPLAPGAIASAPRFARLTHFQWQNAARDLLHLAAYPALATPLQADAVIGFDNNNAGTALDVSFNLRSDYERAAEALANFVVQDATAVARLLPANLPTALEAKARVVIRSLGERAYRRPMSTSDVDELWALFAQGPALVAQTDSFNAGLQVLIAALLQSPFFVYRTELGTGENPSGFALTQFELATRMSFALTDTMPDAELFEAARSNRLTNPADLKQQALRLLKTPAAADSATHFHEQLFRLASFDKIRKDAKAFPTFGTDSAALLKQESRLFLDDIVKGEQPASAILASTTSFVNTKLAALYGASGTFGEAFKKTDLNASQRKGLLTQLGFLAANAGAVDPDPIHRGVFISEVILCKTLPPPAMDVKPVPAASGKTNRERVEDHTGKGTCGAVCHATLINPLGYAFESFDAVGRFRTTDNGAPVDASGQYDELAQGSVTFRNATELSDHLSRSADFHACYLGNWLQYLWSRSAHDNDEASLKDLVKASMDGRSVRELLVNLVTSPSFGRNVP